MYINKCVVDIYIKYIYFVVMSVLCEIVNFEIILGYRFVVIV